MISLTWKTSPLTPLLQGEGSQTVRFLGKAIAYTYTRASDRLWKVNTKLHLNDFRLDIASLHEGLLVCG